MTLKMLVLQLLHIYTHGLAAVQKGGHQMLLACNTSCVGLDLSSI